jgi:hypothetical protein
MKFTKVIAGRFLLEYCPGGDRSGKGSINRCHGFALHRIGAYAVAGGAATHLAPHGPSTHWFEH